MPNPDPRPLRELTERERSILLYALPWNTIELPFSTVTLRRVLAWMQRYNAETRENIMATGGGSTEDDLLDTEKAEDVITAVQAILDRALYDDEGRHGLRVDEATGELRTDEAVPRDA